MEIFVISILLFCNEKIFAVLKKNELFELKTFRLFLVDIV